MSESYVDYFKSFAKILKESLEENCKMLCELDASAGDGDHGTTILRGVSAAYTELMNIGDSTTISHCFKTIGYAMLKNMGGASGPIFSTLFIQASIVTKGKDTLVGKDLLDIIESTEKGLYELTLTKPGEKTMLDSIHGALLELTANVKEGTTWEDSLEMAEIGAVKGMEATKDMMATKGRAKYLGERSRGFVDAGAMSCSLIFKALNKAKKH